jgi:hypothetical protein
MDQRPGPPLTLLERVAAALSGADGPAHPPLVSPPPHERALLLRMARNVAHTGERQDAPLTSYLVGRFVESRRAAGATEAEALAEAARLIEEVVGPSPEEG